MPLPAPDHLPPDPEPTDTAGENPPDPYATRDAVEPSPDSDPYATRADASAEPEPDLFATRDGIEPTKAAPPPPSPAAPPPPGDTADAGATADLQGPSPPLPCAALFGWPSFSGYEILDELGRGGMGIVYRARDCKRNQVVALKTLQGLHPNALVRFKHEFRLLADVAHPNLVPLYELCSDGAVWCFTMELVEGVDLLTYIRHGPSARALGKPGQVQPPLTTPAQGQRLRNVLAQLGEGIQALHAAGKLHRDIKPSNALVTAEGRVVLLDFGLAAEMKAGIHQSTEPHVLGTIAYMSPEQAAAQPVSTATDWYSVGVILYEALTGNLPFLGDPWQILRDKAQLDPPVPRQLAPSVPEDLNDLCVELLCREPRARPTGPDVIRRLSSSGTTRASAPASPGPHPTALLGRERHLQALEDALRAVQAGETVIVHVWGRSGMGKSALLQAFLEPLQEHDRAVVLAGQCYEKESVPYKAFDSLVDSLAQYLGRLSALEVQAVLPRDMASLARIFPVLRGLQAAPALPRTSHVPDLQEVRRRAFLALRELLARLGDQRLLVLALDDLQWGDLDSLALYQDLVQPPDPPRLLLVGSYRSEEVETSPFLQALLASPQPGGETAGRRQLAVEPLTPLEVRELALRLLGEEGVAHPELAEAVAREAGGNPFFVYELVQNARAGAELGDQAASSLSLQSVLWARVQRLPDQTRRLLEVLAVAGRPLGPAEASRAAGLSSDERAAVASLSATRLLRSTGSGAGTAITTYHDRIRETVVAHLPPERVRECHHHLAVVLEATGRADPEALALHFQGAGEPEKAGAYLVQAADKAAAALAFNRAARLYKAALALRPADAPDRHALRIQLADALANGRRGAEAAPVYLEAAAEATTTEALELRRRAAEQLLWSGRIDEGMDVIRGLLASMGMRLPKTPFRALLSIVYHRFWIWLRGLGFCERSAAELAPEELVRIDTCWSIALGLCCVDPFRGLEFQTRYLLLALRAGEPSRIVRALAMEVGHSSCGGGRNRKRTEHIFRTALGLAERLHNPHALALTLLGGGMGTYFEGRWRESRELYDRAIALLRDQCTGVTWELNEGNFNALRALEQLGELRELSRRLPVLLQDAEARGDRYAATNLRTRLSYLVSLMNDRPDQAEEDMRQAMEQWSDREFHLQHYFKLTTHTDILHYRGDATAAWKLLLECWPSVSRSLLLRIQISRITMWQLRARSALALAALPGEEAERSRLVRLAGKSARVIEGEKMAWATPEALLIRAGGAAILGQTTESQAILAQAEAGFRAADMGLFAAVARRRRGQMLGGEAGKQLVLEAEAWMTGQDIRNPARWIAMYAPGFPE